MKIFSFSKLFFSFCFFFITAFSSDNFTKEKIFDQIFTEHVKSIKNLELENSPLIISFSATPGMGKTTLSKILEEKLSAVRISSDEARILFKKNGRVLEKEGFVLNARLLEEYFSYLIYRLQDVSKNYLLILDMNLSAFNYKKLIGLTNKFEIPLFLIRLELSKEEAINRISLREMENKESYLKFMDKWYNDYLDFDILKCDYFLDTTLPIDEKTLKDLLDRLKPLISKKD